MSIGKPMRANNEMTPKPSLTLDEAKQIADELQRTFETIAGIKDIPRGLKPFYQIEAAEFKSTISKLEVENAKLREALKIAALGETQWDGVEAMHAARKALEECEDEND